MVSNFPKVGYTEFNKTIYDLLKTFNVSKLKDFDIYNNDNKKFIAWNLSHPNNDFKDIYMCHKSGKKYYNLKQLVSNKKIYELW